MRRCSCSPRPNTPEEIGTILSLDDELPLVWGATRLQVWRDAFAERVAALGEKLTAAELPVDLANGAIRSLLKCVPLLRPALVMHAAVASSDPAAACDALKTLPDTADALRAALVELDEAADFPCRVPVSDLAVPLDSSWQGAATAPSVAAQIVLGKVLPTPDLLSCLWTVQMTIPRWFERACLYELYPHFLALAKEPAR